MSLLLAEILYFMKVLILPPRVGLTPTVGSLGEENRLFKRDKFLI
jgi:hypothetical protein